MKRGVRAGLAGPALVAALAGCFGPQPPMFDDGRSERVVSWRGGLPVAPGADGTWVLHQDSTGIFGQGTKLARFPDRPAGEAPAAAGGRKDGEVPGWTVELPPEFALTSKVPGSPNSAVSDPGSGSMVVLVGGRPGRTGPTDVARVDTEHGTLAWRHELADGALVSYSSEGSSSVLVEAACAPDGCRVTGWDPWSGQQRWERTEPGATSVLDGCGRDAVFRNAHRCETYLVSGERMSRVNPETGEPHWVEGLRLPEGRIDRVGLQADDRLIVVTAPAEDDCRAAVVGSAVTSGTGDEGWRLDVTWDQPESARDPATGCRWDRTVPLDAGFRLVVPDAQGAYVLNPYFGTLRPVSRLAPGEYPVPDAGRTIVRAPGRADRDLNDPASPVRPSGLGPEAVVVGEGFWQDGRQLYLYGRDGRMLWRTESACRANLTRNGALRYCDGGELVLLSPVARK
ncbi:MULTISPECIES: PQQ-binding-like beta-propeller repeat protein [unclassified Streptomyces]|uniref:outer membrane protein assembly factor BamB family protein n=1 Tax=unclassified Streptomyces TaxID=2593676 RepID=UPI002252B107|nr:PQQ-binding-like beta-propeller repeat protein [Streptomyces sp. NBC_00047]MCX5610055.1 hypothetical protein [Streptomyces sp. NBC_00047]